jgi:prepilin-type N-terminal cleavage/methylation domain-containing protein
MKQRSCNQKGFTILELMVALTVLATLLLIATVVLINLGALFSKGTHQAAVQNTTRNLIADVVGQIKLGPSAPQMLAPADPTADASKPDGYTSSGVGVVCIGNQRYTYMLNSQLDVDSSKHVLWRDSLTSAGGCQPVADFTTADNPTDSPAEHSAQPGSGSELMPGHTRLVRFLVRQLFEGTYSISITVAYGDGDLITYNPASGGTATCKGGSGDQFCATASLTGTATQRIQ